MVKWVIRATGTKSKKRLTAKGIFKSKSAAQKRAKRINKLCYHARARVVKYKK